MAEREYYFPEILKKTNIAVLAAFKNVQVAKYDADGNILAMRDCPIVFGHKGKFLTKIQKEANKSYNLYLPLLSLIITGMQRNEQNTRGGHLIPLHKYFDGSDTNITNLLGPQTYTITYSLSIISQKMRDAEIILEQIIPMFRPYKNVTIREFTFIPEFTRDIKINLDGVTPNFVDEVDPSDIPRVEFDLELSCEINFYKPISLSSLVKTVKTEFYDSTLTPAVSAELLETYTYSVSGDSDNYGVIEDSWT